MINRLLLEMNCWVHEKKRVKDSRVVTEAVCLLTDTAFTETVKEKFSERLKHTLVSKRALVNMNSPRKGKKGKSKQKES